MKHDVSESPILIYGVYIAAFVPLVFLYAFDFISDRWRSIWATRRIGFVQVGLSIPCVLFLFAYISLNIRKGDHKEAAAAMAVVVVNTYNLFRTIWGLLQLWELRNWTIQALKTLLNIGYSVPSYDVCNSTRSRSLKTTILHFYNRHFVDWSKQKEPKEKMDLEDLKHTVDHHMMVNRTLLDNEFKNNPFFFRLSCCGSKNSGIKRHSPRSTFLARRLQSRIAEECAVRWLASFLARFGAEWLHDTRHMNSTSLSSLSSELNNLKKQTSVDLAIVSILHTTRSLVSPLSPLHRFCTSPSSSRTSTIDPSDQAVLPFGMTGGLKMERSLNFIDYIGTIRDATRDDWHKTSLNELPENYRAAVFNMNHVQLACFVKLMGETYDEYGEFGEKNAWKVLEHCEAKILTSRHDPKMDTWMYQLGCDKNKGLDDFFSELPFKMQFIQEALWKTDEANLLLQASVHVDNALALESGERLDLYLQRNTCVHGSSEFQTQFDLEMTRMRSERWNQSGSSLNPRETARFLGCVTEYVRSRLSAWLSFHKTRRPWRQDWTRSIQSGLVINASEQLRKEMLELEKHGVQNDKNKGMHRSFYMRLLWETQWFLVSNNSFTDLRTQPHMMMLFILGFPSLKFRKNDEAFPLEHREQLLRDRGLRDIPVLGSRELVDTEAGNTIERDSISDIEAGITAESDSSSDIEAGITIERDSISDIEAGITTESDSSSDIEAGITIERDSSSDIEAGITIERDSISDIEAGITAKSDSSSDIEAGITAESDPSRLSTFYTAEAVGGPHELKLLLQPSQEKIYLIMISKEDRFDWEKWKEAFLGRLSAQKVWRRSSLSSKHEQIKDGPRNRKSEVKIAQPVTTKKGSSIGLDYDITYWEGWPPHTPRIAFFETECLHSFFEKRKNSISSFAISKPERHQEYIRLLDVALKALDKAGEGNNSVQDGKRMLQEGREKRGLEVLGRCIARTGDREALKTAVHHVINKIPVIVNEERELRLKMNEWFERVSTRKIPSSRARIHSSQLKYLAHCFGLLYESNCDPEALEQKVRTLFYVNQVTEPVTDVAIRAAYSYLVSEPASSFAPLLPYYLAIAHQSRFRQYREPIDQELSAQKWVSLATDPAYVCNSFSLEIGHLLERGYFWSCEKNRMKSILRFFRASVKDSDRLAEMFRENLVRSQLGPSRAFCFGLGRQPTHALRVYKAIATATDQNSLYKRRSLNRLGVIYHLGDPRVPHDHREAQKWYEMAVKHGSSSAAVNMRLLEGVNISSESEIGPHVLDSSTDKSVQLNNSAIQVELQNDVSGAEDCYERALNEDENNIFAKYNLLILRAVRGRQHEDAVFNNLLQEVKSLPLLSILRQQVEKLEQTSGWRASVHWRDCVWLEDWKDCLIRVKIISFDDNIPESTPRSTSEESEAEIVE